MLFQFLNYGMDYIANDYLKLFTNTVIHKCLSKMLKFLGRIAHYYYSIHKFRIFNIKTLLQIFYGKIAKYKITIFYLDYKAIC